MQKIMMPAKLWCDHAEGFELGLRSWELNVGQWERASGGDSCRCSQVHSGDEYDIDCLREQFAVVHMCKQYRSSNSFVAMVLFSRNFGASPTVSAGNGARADDDNRMQVDSLKKGKEKGTRQTSKTRKELAQATQATQTSTPERTVVERDIG